MNISKLLPTKGRAIVSLSTGGRVLAKTPGLEVVVIDADKKLRQFKQERA